MHCEIYKYVYVHASHVSLLNSFFKCQQLEEEKVTKSVDIDELKSDIEKKQQEKKEKDAKLSDLRLENSSLYMWKKLGELCKIYLYFHLFVYLNIYLFISTYIF